MTKVLENKLRRQANRLGLVIKKSRAKKWNIDDHGEYMLVDSAMNAVVAGTRFDLDLDDIQAWLDDYESELKHA